MSSIPTIQELHDVNHLDLAQKVKVKWGIEGDKKSKIFQGIIIRLV